jgi:hypothetical protein
MTNRKFYRTVIQIEVLSEEPLADSDNLESIYYDITEGDCSGAVKTIAVEQVNGSHMASLLNSQGSDPGFFQLTEDGDDEDSDDSTQEARS